MKLLRLMGDLTQLRREFRELSSESASEEEQAKYELTASARRFSRRTKRVVDDKLTFSATLMRAGEVHAANRLLEEVELDVRTEEAALIEKMNEVKVARANTRERMTRVRLARMLAVSVAGSLLMGFSALGMAAAGFVQEREQDQIRRNVAAQRRALEDRAGGKGDVAAKLKGLDRDVARLLANGIPRAALTSLTAEEIHRIGVLTNGNVDVAALHTFLVGVLPTPDLAFQVVERIASRVEKAVAGADAPTVDIAAPRVKKRAERAAGDAQSEEQASGEPEAAPSPEETEEPAEEEQTERDGRQHGTGGGGDDDEEPGAGGNLPGGGNVPGGSGDLLGED